jgi:serpin B
MSKSLNSNPAAESTTNFGLALFKQQVLGADGNVLLSPTSVAVALAMTMNGAASTTLDVMKSALALPADASVAVINSSMEALIAALTDPASGVELNVANAIWANQSVTFNDDFLARVAVAFKAKIASADFGAKATVDDMNAWVNEATHEKISTIMESIDPNMVMFLLNAIYFKGKWTVPFKKDLSRQDDFFNGDKVLDITYMYKKADMRYVRGDVYQAVSLPFGDSKRIALQVFLPNADVAIDDFIAGLEASAISGLSGRWEQEVDLVLPRFKVEYEADLVKVLTALGMGEACERGADFSGMVKAPVYIGEVKHKTFAKFDEEGGEAAAVTSVGMMLESVRMTQHVHVTRPFVMTLVDEETGTLLFIGKVVAPE